MANPTLRTQILECVGGYVDPPGSPWPAVFAVEKLLESPHRAADLREPLHGIVTGHTDAGSFDRDDSDIDHERLVTDRLVEIIGNHTEV